MFLSSAPKTAPKLASKADHRDYLKVAPKADHKIAPKF